MLRALLLRARSLLPSSLPSVQEALQLAAELLPPFVLRTDLLRAGVLRARLCRARLRLRLLVLAKAFGRQGRSTVKSPPAAPRRMPPGPLGVLVGRANITN